MRRNKIKKKKVHLQLSAYASVYIFIPEQGTAENMSILFFVQVSLNREKHPGFQYTRNWKHFKAWIVTENSNHPEQAQIT